VPMSVASHNTVCVISAALTAAFICRVKFNLVWFISLQNINIFYGTKHTGLLQVIKEIVLRPVSLTAMALVLLTAQYWNQNFVRHV